MNHWTEPELSHLEHIAGETPYVILAKSYNQWADKHGYPKRTIKALEHAAWRHGISLCSTGKWVTSGYVARVLGIQLSTVRSWMHRGFIPKRIQSQRRYILRSDMVQLAREKPRLFSGISSDRLYCLFEERELADHIARNYKNKNYLKKPVRIVETGMVYESVAEASRRVHVIHTRIRTAIRTGTRAAGFHWEFVA